MWKINVDIFISAAREWLSWKKRCDRAQFVTPKTKPHRGSILNKNLGKKLFSCTFTSFCALLWHVLNNLIYHCSLRYTFNPIVLLSRQHMTENGFFSEFQKTKHVEPRAFSQKASKPSRNESWLGYISYHYPLPIVHMGRLRSHRWLTNKSKI